MRRCDVALVLVSRSLARCLRVANTRGLEDGFDVRHALGPHSSVVGVGRAISLAAAAASAEGCRPVVRGAVTADPRGREAARRYKLTSSAEKHEDVAGVSQGMRSDPVSGPMMGQRGSRSPDPQTHRPTVRGTSSTWRDSYLSAEHHRTVAVAVVVTRIELPNDPQSR